MLWESGSAANKYAIAARLRSAVLSAVPLGNGVWNTSGGIGPVLLRLYGATLPVFAKVAIYGDGTRYGLT